MVKKRRVVVISPMRTFRYVTDATVIVVPLSEVEPLQAQAWHHPIRAARYTGLRTCWAKGDLVAHVGLARLDRIFYAGNWAIPVMDPDDLEAIRRVVGNAVGIESLRD